MLDLAEGRACGTHQTEQIQWLAERRELCDVARQKRFQIALQPVGLLIERHCARDHGRIVTVSHQLAPIGGRAFSVRFQKFAPLRR